MYSVQKTMGRPRKRRRDEGADAGPEQAATTQNGQANRLDGVTMQPSSSSFGLASPPELADLPGRSEVYAQAQLDPGLVGIYGPAPPMAEFE